MNNQLLPDMVSVSDLQRNYSLLVNKAKKSRNPLLVLKKNQLEVILLSPDLYQSMTAKARRYEEEQALAAVSRYEKAKKKGRLKKASAVDELFD